MITLHDLLHDVHRTVNFNITSDKKRKAIFAALQTLQKFINNNPGYRPPEMVEWNIASRYPGGKDTLRIISNPSLSYDQKVKKIREVMDQHFFLVDRRQLPALAVDNITDSLTGLPGFHPTQEYLNQLRGEQDPVKKSMRYLHLAVARHIFGVDAHRKKQQEVREEEKEKKAALEAKRMAVYKELHSSSKAPAYDFNDLSYPLQEAIDTIIREREERGRESTITNNYHTQVDQAAARITRVQGLP